MARQREAVRSKKSSSSFAKMEKSQAKPKSKKVLKFLPRTVSSISFFQNPPFSPDRDKRLPSSSSSYSSELINSTKRRLRSHVGTGFSGPLISLIPDEARAKNRNDRDFDVNEPTSPKVSCMGQIKHKNKKSWPSSAAKADKRSSFSSSASSSFSKLKRDVNKPPRSSNTHEKQSSTLKRIFSRARGGNKKKPSDTSGNNCRKPPLLPDRAPSLSQMKRFASGRDTLASFDWSAEVGTVLDADRQDYYHYYSDEERRESDQEEEDDKVIIPFSAPIPVGGGGVRVNPQSRKEINLWKRRTMDPPRPLELYQPATVRAN